MALSVYLPRTPVVVNRMYQNALERRSPFVDSPTKRQEHFFRGVRQPEKRNFLNKSYSIGPHDSNFLLCGFHHAEVFGWWFDPSVHQREIDDDDVFWDAAVDLTPDHLDTKSKVKLVREFCLSPSGNWLKHFGPDWTRAYRLSKTDPIIKSLLDAEDILLGLRLAIRRATADKNGGQYPSQIPDEYFVDINTACFLDIFDFLEKAPILDNMHRVYTLMTQKPFLERCSIFMRALKWTEFRGVRPDLIPEILMTAFVPVSKTSEQAHMNIGNFNACMEAFGNIDPILLKRTLLDEWPKDPLLFIFANCCRTYREVEPDIYKFDF